MNVTPVRQNNLNFEKLYAPKNLILNKTGKVSGKQLLKSETIKECADKYDVFVRKGRLNGYIETGRNTLIGTGAGAGAGAGLGAIATLGLVDIGAPIALGLFFGAIFTMLGTAFGAVRPHEASTYEYFVKGKKDDIETKEYLLATPKDLNNISSLTKEIEEKQQL